MPHVIKLKNSTEAGKVPVAGDLATAELAINLADQKLYSKDASGTVFELGGGGGEAGEVPGGGSGDRPVDPELGELFFDTDLNALLYWNGSSWEQITSETPGAGGDYVKLDDKGTQQSIVGGGGLDLAGSLTVDSSVRVNTTQSSGRPGLAVNGDLSINTGGYDLRLFGGDNFDVNSVTCTSITRDALGETQIKASGGWGDNVYLTMSTSAFIMGNNNPNRGPDPISGSTAHCHAWGGLNTEFGTNTAQLGNVAPLNDWSCYPARA